MSNVIAVIAFVALGTKGAVPPRPAEGSRQTQPLIASPREDQSGRISGVAVGTPENAWRYVRYQRHWWYWSPSERWSYFDGRRWIDLDLINQPMTKSREFSAAGAGGQTAVPPPEELRFQFGKMPVPRSRAGSFDLGNSNVATGRNVVGSFEGGATLPHAVMATPSEPVAMPANPYGPDSNYGAYGSTNPFRGGLHTGSGGNFGYGLGAERAAPFGRANQVGPFKQSR